MILDGIYIEFAMSEDMATTKSTPGEEPKEKVDESTALPLTAYPKRWSYTFHDFFPGVDKSYLYRIKKTEPLQFRKFYGVKDNYYYFYERETEIWYRVKGHVKGG